MGEPDGDKFSFDKEKEEDLKCSMLSDIDSLIGTLSEDGVDLSRIPQVTSASSYENVEAVLRMLRHKNDHSRYCSFAEEILLSGVSALEELFDGNKTYFGKYSPDLTGWHNHVNVKLKRMRHDTGQIVQGVMQDYGMGPMMRVMAELIPNMVLYSRMRKQQKGSSRMFNDMDMMAANRRVRDVNDNI
jgi:hypothetical protein